VIFSFSETIFIPATVQMDREFYHQIMTNLDEIAVNHEIIEENAEVQESPSLTR